MKPRLSSIFASLFFLAALGLVVWFGLPTADSPGHGDRLFVVTTIYPLADFAENIGGDLVYVSNVIPAGAEPHDYEPSPREVTQVIDADVLITLGGGLDTWAVDIADETDSRGGKVVNIEDKVPLTVTAQGIDPHIWLDPVEAQNIVAAIRDALIEADPVHTEQYRLNAEAYLQSLQELDRSFATGLDDCELNDIMVSHDAFGYLARRYDFVVHPISGLSPETEPSVRDLTNLSKQARNLGVKTIFFETLVSPELAETLAKEVGATTAVLNPLEGLSDDELQAGDNYISVMQADLEALRTAMLCQ